MGRLRVPGMLAAYYDAKELLLSRVSVFFSFPVAALCSRIQPSDHPAPHWPQLNAGAAPLCLLLFSLLLKYRPLFLASQSECWTLPTFNRTYTCTLTGLLHVINYLGLKKNECAPEGKLYAFKYMICSVT